MPGSTLREKEKALLSPTKINKQQVKKCGGEDKDPSDLLRDTRKVERKENEDLSATPQVLSKTG